MKKPNYWLTAVLCGAMVVSTTVTSCDKDDDDNSTPGNGSEVVAGAKPVIDKDFTVKVEGNVVTITSNLTQSNQWVNYAGATYTIKDGVAKIDIAVKGDYKMTLAYFDNNQTVESDEFTVTIAGTDLSFLDNGIYKALTGGKEAYEAAAAKADDKGVFTRSWRLDAFLNEQGNAYSKVFSGPGSFCLEKDAACYNGGVTATGAGAWRALGAVEDATISFDFVNKKVKVEFKDGVKLQAPAGTSAPNKEEALTGTFYGTFTAAEIDGDATYMGAIDGWAGSTTDLKGLEITLDGDNVRIPYLKGALSYPLSKEADVKTIKVFSTVSTEDNEQGIMIQTAVSYNSGEDDDKNAIVVEDFCNLMMTYVCEELESTYKYELPAIEVEGEWVSEINIWGNGDAAPTIDAPKVTVKGDGEYEYTATVTKGGTGECMVVNFDSNKSYALFLGENATAKVDEVKVTINDEEVTFEAMDCIGADGGTEYFRIQFFNTWGGVGTAYEFAQDAVIKIKVKISGL